MSNYAQPLLWAATPQSWSDLASAADPSRPDWTKPSMTRSTLYFDAQIFTRASRLFESDQGRQDIYLRKADSDSPTKRLRTLSVAENAGVKHGVVQDKFWLPGLLKLKTLRYTGFFGNILRSRRVRLLGI